MVKSSDVDVDHLSLEAWLYLTIYCGGYLFFLKNIQDNPKIIENVLKNFVKNLPRMTPNGLTLLPRFLTTGQ